RGGIDVIRRVSTGHPQHAHVELSLKVDGRDAEYGFEIGPHKFGGFEIVHERCAVYAASEPARFEVRAGVVTSTEPVLPWPGPGRLYLVTVASLPVFRPVFDALVGMGFYNFNPDAIRAVQAPDASELLARDGRNLASILDRLACQAPQVK